MRPRWLDSPRVLFALSALLALVALASQFRLDLPSREVEPASALLELRERDDLNVVFLVVDTLRADRLGAYGYERPTSTVLDELARYGILFEDVVAQSSWTKTSMASLWTGTLPMRHGVLRYDHVLPDEARMPAEILREAGLRTIGLWRNGWVEPNFGFAQGFDLYMRPVVGAERMRVHREARTVTPIAGTDEDLTLAALDFLERFGRERFFLYLHYMDVHQYAYDERAAIFGTSYSDAYDQSIHWVDRLIGVLLARLEELDLLSRTLVVIASDHGEAFLEHGYEGHARNLYDEVTRVPWIVLPPFLLDPGVRVERTVANVDIWPTLLDLLGLPALPDADGRSQLPAILAAAEGRSEVAEPRSVFAQLERGWGRPRAENLPTLVSVTRDGKRLITALGASRPAELYDRRRDPAEQDDLAARDPDWAAPLREELEAYRAATESPWGRAPHAVELDELRLNHLRALGYAVRPDPLPETDEAAGSEDPSSRQPAPESPNRSRSAPSPGSTSTTRSP